MLVEADWACLGGGVWGWVRSVEEPGDPEDPPATRRNSTDQAAIPQHLGELGMEMEIDN